MFSEPGYKDSGDNHDDLQNFYLFQWKNYEEHFRQDFF